MRKTPNITSINIGKWYLILIPQYATIVYSILRYLILRYSISLRLKLPISALLFPVFLFSALILSGQSSAQILSTFLYSPSTNVHSSSTNVYSSNTYGYTLNTVSCRPDLYVQSSNKISDILSALIQKIKGAPSIKMEIEFITSEYDSYSSVVIASGESYMLENQLFELYCDGESKWMINHSEREITIFYHDSTQTDIIENPMGFFKSIDKGYNFSERANKVIVNNVNEFVNGKQVWSMDLKPKDKRVPYKTITLSVDTETNLPLLVKYTSRDDSVYVIVIKTFKILSQPIPQSSFKLPKVIPSDYKLNDLR